MALKNARQNLFSSPEISVKQQRLNTDQKAPRMLDFQSSLPFRVDEVVIAINKVVQSHDLNSITLSSIPIFPTKCNSYDTQLLQRAVGLRKQSANIRLDLSKPHEPLRFYSISWMMCMCGNVNTSCAQPSFRPTIEQSFERFATHFKLDKASPAENGASSIDQIGLALLLQYLSWSNAAVDWLTEKRSCDTVTNGLLMALNDRKKNPKVPSTTMPSSWISRQYEYYCCCTSLPLMWCCVAG
jgi:hypothetical protein